MIHLFDLPNEVLCAIGIEVPVKTLKDLRLCNSRLREALAPVIFASVAIDIAPRAAQAYACSRYVKRLSIGSWRQCSKQLDLSALRYLRNVRVVRWQLAGHESQETVTRIFGYLSSLPFLSELHFISYQPSLFPISFDRYPIRNLSVLSVQGPYSDGLLGITPSLFHLISNNPFLTSLSLDIAWSSNERFSDLMHNLPPDFFASLRHLRLPRWHVDISPACIKMMPNLVSLDVTLPPSPDADHNVLWAILREEHVYLKDLSVTVVTRELLDYLQSYTGLESFVLNDVESDHSLSKQFYTKVLPKHAETLVSLTVDGRNNHEWCLTLENAKVFQGCKNLKDLSVAVKTDDLGVIETLLPSVPRSLRTLCLTWNTSNPECFRSFFFKLYDSDLESCTSTSNQTLIIYADIVYLLGRLDKADADAGFVFRGFKTHRSQLNWTAAKCLCGRAPA
ncbi:hypothetical protein V5O48_012018 [Marasmius crinis-equi]|uniref:F-box domain-containing protein n=1 Tax=Marasmius crinis-equi TaxID=585013 RepID=A0ABR3F406_9AGAR